MTSRCCFGCSQVLWGRWGGRWARRAEIPAGDGAGFGPVTWVYAWRGRGPQTGETCTVGHTARRPVLRAKMCRNTGHTSLLTGIGRVGSWAIEEGRGAAQIGHGGSAVSIHARGDRVIVGLLRGGARHVPMWWYAAWVAGETWGAGAKPRMRVASGWVAGLGSLGKGRSLFLAPSPHPEGKGPGDSWVDWWC